MGGFKRDWQRNDKCFFNFYFILLIKFISVAYYSNVRQTLIWEKNWSHK